MHWEKIAAARTVVLVLLGFISLAVAAFLLDYRAGWAATGVELLLLAYLTDAPAAPVRR